jgi:signal transduction histidine kinase
MPIFLLTNFNSRLPKEIPKNKRTEYRQFFFQSDLAQSLIVLKLLTVSIALFGFSDYLLLDLSAIFFVVITVRLLIVLLSVLVIIKIKGTKNFQSYDRWLFAYLLIFILFSLFINITRLQDFAVQAVILAVSIFAFYLAIPTRYFNQAFLSSAYTLGELVLLLFSLNMHSNDVSMPVFFVLVFANIIAGVASWEFNYYRWLVYKDLSELKKSERFVVIGQTAGMVGHDIRNPLQAITSDLYLIQEELNSKPTCPSQEIAESIASINENIEYINKIVSDLQDYTRNIKLNITMVKVSSVFTGLLSRVPRTIRLQIEVDKDLTLKTDATYIKRIIENLITNAVQAMPNGGTLTLEGKRSGDKVIIAVSDTGAGISDEAKLNLFKPLFTTKAKGQGLGLAVVKRLVDALGGKISFESTEGKGTRFVIELPTSK